jgi:uncharacterized protein YhaN
MTTPELTQAIQEALPDLIANDPAIRDFVLQTISDYYASKEETESRFDRIMAELQRDREEQTRENRALLAEIQDQKRSREEHNRQWEESSRRWEEQTRENRAVLAEIQVQLEICSFLKGKTPLLDLDKV